MWSSGLAFFLRHGSSPVCRLPAPHHGPGPCRHRRTSVVSQQGWGLWLTGAVYVSRIGHKERVRSYPYPDPVRQPRERVVDGGGTCFLAHIRLNASSTSGRSSARRTTSRRTPWPSSSVVPFLAPPLRLALGCSSWDRTTARTLVLHSAVVRLGRSMRRHRAAPGHRAAARHLLHTVPPSSAARRLVQLRRHGRRVRRAYTPSAAVAKLIVTAGRA